MFNWIKALLLSPLSRRRERERERERGERERERGVRALNRADAERERERERCARWTEQTHRERERERERCVRALGEQDLALARQYGDSQKLGLGAFLKGKKSLGVCNVAKLATLCISISPTTGWATGQTGNTRCVNRALKKISAVKINLR